MTKLFTALCVTTGLACAADIPPQSPKTAEALALAEAYGDAFKDRTNMVIGELEAEVARLSAERLVLLTEIERLKALLEPSVPFTAIRIDIGATAPWTDAQGRVWGPDTSSLGRVSWTQVAATKPESEAALATLYRTERIGSRLTYDPEVPAGEYVVRLRFRETYYRDAGRRVFSVKVNGEVVREKLDILKEAGGRDIALVIEHRAKPVDGRITVELERGSRDIPTIAALEIERLL